MNLGGLASEMVAGINFDLTTNPQNGSGGYGRVLNSLAELVVRISFTGNSSGAIVLDALSP